MKNFDTRTYNVSDFVEWEARHQLELSPDFQRRSVWSQKAKSYLIDTIVRGKPIPKLLLTQEIQDRRNVRIVVDGQQRLRAILEYVSDGYPISRAHNRDYAGKRFSQLPDNLKTEFLKFEIGVDLLYDVPYKDILDIFARLNTYTVKLNGQELLNSKYVGYFKQLVYGLGFDYVEYFLAANVLTKSNVTRMLEAELASDLTAALLAGVQTNKNIETLYRNYEDDFDDVDKIREQFDEIMTIISSIYPADDIAATNWSRIHLFYTLFTAIGHSRFGLKGLEKSPRPSITIKKFSRVRIALDDISAKYDFYTEDKDNAKNTPKDWALFIERSRRATTDTGSRVDRSHFVLQQLKEALE